MTQLRTRTAPSPGRAAAATARPTFRIGVGVHNPAAALIIRTSPSSCWAGFFGAFPLPIDGALDALADAIELLPDLPTRVELTGAPAACLLPALWLRTIWLGPEAPIHLRWPEVEPPGSDPRETLAAQMCCRIVTDISCADERAWAEWGIDTAQPGAAPAALLDTMLGLIDCWDINLRGANEVHGQLVRVRAAFESCIDRGRRRVALYGAGTHTRGLGALLMEPRLEIACIIDDNPAIQGSRLWGFPIVSREQAIGMGLEAVILSANSHEDKLWNTSQCLRDAGIEVIRLYGPS